MAASGSRPRRPAIWPYLVMPVIVLLVFYVLTKLHAGAEAQRSASATPTATDARP